jgi:hypothetical protein
MTTSWSSVQWKLEGIKEARKWNNRNGEEHLGSDYQCSSQESYYNQVPQITQTTKPSNAWFKN